jgi:hypothetical protein
LGVEARVGAGVGAEVGLADGNFEGKKRDRSMSGKWRSGLV